MSGKKDASPWNFETTSDTSSNCSSIRRRLHRAYNAVACRYNDSSLKRTRDCLWSDNGSENVGKVLEGGGSPSLIVGAAYTSKSSFVGESANSYSDDTEMPKGSTNDKLGRNLSNNKMISDDGSSVVGEMRDFRSGRKRQEGMGTGGSEQQSRKIEPPAGKSKSSKRTASTQSETIVAPSHHPHEFSVTLNNKKDLSRRSTTPGCAPSLSKSTRSRSPNQSHKRFKTLKGSNSSEIGTMLPEKSPALHSTVNQGPVIPSSLIMPPYVRPSTQCPTNFIGGYPATLIGQTLAIQQHSSVPTNITVPTCDPTTDASSLSNHPRGDGLEDSKPSAASNARAKLKQKHLQQQETLDRQQKLEMQQHLQLRQLERLISNPSSSDPKTSLLTPAAVTSRFLPEDHAPCSRAMMSGAQHQPSETNSNMGQKEIAACEGKTLPMYVPTDDEFLSEYQILLRKNLEYFEAGQEEVEIVVPGRKKPLVLGQVGIRCRFCKTLPVRQRPAGTVYFPTKMHRLYHSARRIATTHFFQSCSFIDPELRTRLTSFQDGRTTTSAGHAGTAYWSNSARALDITETGNGLRFGGIQDMSDEL